MEKIDLTNKFMLLPTNLHHYFDMWLVTKLIDKLLLIDLSTFRTRYISGIEALEMINKYGVDCFVNMQYGVNGSDNGFLWTKTARLYLNDLRYEDFCIEGSNYKVVVLVSDDYTRLNSIGLEYNNYKFVFSFKVIDEIKTIMYINGVHYLDIGGDINDTFYQLDVCCFSHMFFDKDNILHFFIHVGSSDKDSERYDRLEFELSDSILSLSRNQRLYEWYDFKGSRSIKSSNSDLQLEALMVKSKLALGF